MVPGANCLRAVFLLPPSPSTHLHSLVFLRECFNQILFPVFWFVCGAVAVDILFFKKKKIGRALSLLRSAMCVVTPLDEEENQIRKRKQRWWQQVRSWSCYTQDAECVRLIVIRPLERVVGIISSRKFMLIKTHLCSHTQEAFMSLTSPSLVTPPMTGAGRTVGCFRDSFILSASISYKYRDGPSNQKLHWSRNKILLERNNLS